DGRRNTLVRILGPASSTVLKAMVSELNSQDSTSHADFWTHCDVAFVSAMATASASQLLNMVDGDEQDLHDQFKKWNITFRRTAVTDMQLMQTIIHELERRGVKRDGPDHVALISEWDTFYGRALPEVFCEAYKRVDCKSLTSVHRFSYMRGLDGVLPRPPREPAELAAKPEANGKDHPAPTSELAEGRSQVDYLRRLAVQLRQTDRDLRQEDTGKRGEQVKIGAIGVLGSDAYDKLLVLQGVRSEFPDVPVFPTDLDARLFDSHQRQWARTLIVASGYGLEVLPPQQAPIPPFRDAYQTSTFL